jgi:hypothetical protein
MLPQRYAPNADLGFFAIAMCIFLTALHAACGGGSGSSSQSNPPPPQTQESVYSVRAEDAARRDGINKVYVNNGQATLVHGPTGRTATSNNANPNNEYVLRINTANTQINPNADSTLTFNHTAYYNFERTEKNLGTSSKNLDDMLLGVRQMEAGALIPDFKDWFKPKVGPVLVVFRERPTKVYFDTTTLGNNLQHAQLMRDALDSIEACGPSGFPNLSGKIFEYVTSPPTSGIIIQGNSSPSGTEAVDVVRTFGNDGSLVVRERVVLTINTSTSLMTPSAIINFRNTAKHGVGHAYFPDDTDTTKVMNSGRAINSTTDITWTANECMGLRHYTITLPNGFVMAQWP